jgi:Short C-terminal domain
MIILRGMGILFLVLGGAMLAVGLTGFGEDWIAENATCGDEYNRHACAPGEAQNVLKLVGAIFVAVALVELAVSVMWSRAGAGMLGGVDSGFAGTLTPASGWGTGTLTPASGSGSWAPNATVPAPAAPVEGVADRIARLAELRDSGALTEAEFQAQKAKLL